MSVKNDKDKIIDEIVEAQTQLNKIQDKVFSI